MGCTGSKSVPVEDERQKPGPAPATTTTTTETGGPSQSQSNNLTVPAPASSSSTTNSSTSSSNNTTTTSAPSTSSSSVSAEQKAADALEVERRAEKQRRRLSVTPKQVGDISNQDNKAAEEAKQLAAGGKRDSTTHLSEELKAQGHLRHAAQSKKGYVPYNRNKVNQDRAFVKYCLQNDTNISLFGVMDGHGEYGHLVAGFVQEKLPYYLASQVNLKTNPHEAILQAVKSTCEELQETSVNIAFSGTTCVFTLRIGNMLYNANIGDSRVVLCRRTPSGFEALGLSNDQKPENPEEKARILRAGGRVEPLPGPPDEDCGPPRVWLADVDVPGLAMSRSIGDEVSQTVGVISIPEIIEHEIKDDDLFCIWASDGVWEFIKNEEAVEIVYKHMDDLKLAARQLITEANKRWSKVEEVVDDITCVIVSFHNDTSKPQM